MLKLNNTQLKLLAIACMLIDHIGLILCSDNPIMRSIGRIAFPIFAFCVAEGMRHTQNRKRYLLRMLIFAAVSEPCFQLALGFPGLDHINVMWTFLLALLGIMVYEKSGGGILGIIFPVTAAMIAGVFHTDYDLFGVLLVFFFYKTAYDGWDRRGELTTDHRYLYGICSLLLMVTHAILIDLYTEGIPVTYFSLLSLIPLLLYNGQRGRGLKWFFYVFYPAHLLILGLITSL